MASKKFLEYCDPIISINWETMNERRKELKKTENSFTKVLNIEYCANEQIHDSGLVINVLEEKYSTSTT